MFLIVARGACLLRPRPLPASVCGALASGASPSTTSAHAAPIAQSEAAAIQTPFGDTARPAPPSAGPSANPICHESAFRAMYRPMSRGSARSAASGPATAPCRHWPIAKTTMTTTRTAKAPSRAALRRRSGTRSQAPAQRRPNERERRHAPASARKAGDRQLREDDDERVDQEEQPDLGLRQAGLVLRIDREHVEAGEAGEDEQRVQRDDRDERPCAGGRRDTSRCAPPCALSRRSGSGTSTSITQA